MNIQPALDEIGQSNSGPFAALLRQIGGSGAPGPPGPPGGLSSPYSCAPGVAVLDAVYLTGADTVGQALANGVATMPVIGIVASKPTPITCIIRYHDEQAGFVGLAPGATYYASDVTPGAISLAAPVSPPPGHVIQRVGFARSTTTLVVFLDRDIDVL